MYVSLPGQTSAFYQVNNSRRLIDAVLYLGRLHEVGTWYFEIYDIFTGL